MVSGALLLVIAFEFLWLPPAALSTTVIAIYLTAAAVLSYLAFTIQIDLRNVLFIGRHALLV